MSAQTSPRNFARYTTAGFDGATAETAVYTQLRSEWTTPTDTPVGVWSFSALQRAAGDPLAASIASIARVALEGTIDPLVDLVSVLDSSGAIRVSFTASAEGTPWFFLGPQDSIAIRADDATKADILIQDLTAQNLPWWILTEATQANIPIDPFPYSEETLTGGAAVSAWTGRRLEFLSFVGGAGNATLPALADIALGDTITFLRTPGSLEPTIVVDNPATDTVNGLLGTAANGYPIRSVAQAITYTRVTGGWQRPAGEPVASRITATANPTNIPAFQEGTLYILDNLTVDGGVINLPSLASCAAGCRIVIQGTSTATGVHVLTPQAGDTINGVIGGAGVYRYYVENSLLASTYTARPIVEVEHAGSTWDVISDQPAVRKTVAAAGALVPAGGKVYVDITLAADGDITLPAISDLPYAAEYVLTRVGGAGTPRIITPGAPVTVNGVAGITATQWFLTSSGKSITYTTNGSGWFRDQEWDQQQYVAIGGPGVIPSVAGELIVEFNSGLGATVVLPALASVPLGASIYIFRSGVGQPTITCDNAADLVNGVAAAGGNTWRLTNTGESVFYVRVPGGWWRNTPIVFTGISSAADINATTAREQFYQMTGAAGQNLNLPALSTVDTGTTIYTFNNSGNAHNFVPAGTDLIMGVNATLPDAPQDATQLVSFGATIGWVAYVTP